MKRPIYVIDTNILVDYPDIIPSTTGSRLIREQTVDLSNAHIVIPTAVIRELSSFKREASERGKNAQTVLRRLRGIFEGINLKMGNSYSLKSSVTIGTQNFSILPVHKAFKSCLPFSPSDEDMDGQIILAAIVAEFLMLGFAVDGTASTTEVMQWAPTNTIVLLTNDNGLAIRANQRGITTSRYGYKLPDPYTGRRDVWVTKDLLDYYYSNGSIESEIWKLLLPEEAERDLIANEFIVMHSKDEGVEIDYTKESYYYYIGRFDLESDCILPLDWAAKFPEKIMNAGQAMYAEALMNPKFAAVICTGPAGSGKTYMATVYGYTACKSGQYIGVTVVPCASQSTIGFLPGDMNDKMDPEVQPLKNALRSFLLKNDWEIRADLNSIRTNGAHAPKLPSGGSSSLEDSRSLNQKLRDKVSTIWNAWFDNLPIENARGRDFSYEIALYDEFQDQSTTQADTLIKRLGADGKIVITGDTEQVHAPYLDAKNNGLVYASQLLYNNPMVAQVHFTENEVVRHPLVKMIAERQKSLKERQRVLPADAI